MNQLSTTMNLLFMLCGCLAFALLVHGQAQSGSFISIDCGYNGSDYNDYGTISYTSDEGCVDTGTNYNISPDYALSLQRSNLRSFPKGIKNCYTIKSEQAKGNKYLIRAIFTYGPYGNYDSKNDPPEFDLYLDGDHWTTIKIEAASDNLFAEIIHVPATAYIHVCLVNTGLGTPFISALELRPLNNSIYQVEHGSLKLFTRIDVGSTTNDTVRYGLASIESRNVR
ncbi:hypothetical protein Vadar_030250 [Vaccinium darrowii]|uniref:Uncharacterized protein n=1 Tax=Vaccinium darrowii TaxID=229202 RepID=A0ACB7ZNU4_9ERIC|nr:hypothetical protein Vadar_030250 [Vaccinium darrowii]